MEKDEIEILLVEDNANDAEMTIRALKQNNLTSKIFHAKDGVEALEYLFGKGQFEGRDTNNKPKVILLDLNMPKLSGHEVLEKIKLNEVTKMIPVVVLTSSKDDPDISKCYALGANSYIVKPVNCDKFLEVVAGLGMYWVNNNQTPV